MFFHQVGTMTTEAPLDLSMDALDLSKKRPPESPEDLTPKRPAGTPPYPELNVPAFYANPNAFPYPAFIPPYFLPPPAAALLFQNREFAEMKERLQKELIRNLGMAQMEKKAAAAPAPPTPEPPKKPPESPSSVKMVIKNGVLVPKQKQRRYRTERPFGCEHCTAR